MGKICINDMVDKVVKRLCMWRCDERGLRMDLNSEKIWMSFACSVKILTSEYRQLFIDNSNAFINNHHHHEFDEKNSFTFLLQFHLHEWRRMPACEDKSINSSPHLKRPRNSFKGNVFYLFQIQNVVQCVKSHAEKDPKNHPRL